MSNIDAGDSTRSRVNSTEQSDIAPSATQLSCLIRKIAEHQNETNINTWTSLSNTLNDLGPCVKDCRGWKRTWNDHKSKIQNLVVESGTKNLDKLQRLTYECIKRERKKTDCTSNILNVSHPSSLYAMPQINCVFHIRNNNYNFYNTLPMKNVTPLAVQWLLNYDR